MKDNEEIQGLNDSFYLIANGEKSNSLEVTEFKDGIKILDQVPVLNLINVEGSQKEIQEIIEREDFHLIENSIVAKIDPLLFQKLKFEINEQNMLISTLIDVGPYNLDTISELEQIEDIEIKKEYPFISAIHVSFPVNRLLDVAMLGFVNKISDSKGQIVPLGGDQNGQN